VSYSRRPSSIRATGDCCREELHPSHGSNGTERRLRIGPMNLRGEVIEHLTVWAVGTKRRDSREPMKPGATGKRILCIMPVFLPDVQSWSRYGVKQPVKSGPAETPQTSGSASSLQPSFFYRHILEFENTFRHSRLVYVVVCGFFLFPVPTLVLPWNNIASFE